MNKLEYILEKIFYKRRYYFYLMYFQNFLIELLDHFFCVLCNTFQHLAFVLRIRLIAVIDIIMKRINWCQYFGKVKGTQNFKTNSLNFNCLLRINVEKSLSHMKIYFSC